MSDDELDLEAEILQVPRECVDHPPPEDCQGRVYSVMCPDEESCGFWGDMEVEQGGFDPTGRCPGCGKSLIVDFSRTTWGIASKGAGYSNTAWGRRRQQDLINRNKRMERRQWDNVAPLSVVNPERVVNPTPGSPYHPDSKFNKHKKKNTKIIYKKGVT